MLVLYADGQKQISRVRSALPPERQVVLAGDWTDVECRIPEAKCSVFLIETLCASPVLSRLTGLKQRYPNHPVILVTRWDPGNARSLKDIMVEEVVWLREVESDLLEAVRRTCTQTYQSLRCLSVPFEQAAHLPQTLRKALAFACQSEVPVRSVKHLAEAVGSNRRTLWYHWTRVVGVSSPFRLQDFLHWTLLLRAIAKKTPDRTWADVAEDVGVHAHTLWRFAKSLTGCTLPELAAKGQLELTHRFRAQVLEFLLTKRPLDIL